MQWKLFFTILAQVGLTFSFLFMLSAAVVAVYNNVRDASAKRESNNSIGDYWMRPEKIAHNLTPDQFHDAAIQLRRSPYRNGHVLVKNRVGNLSIIRMSDAIQIGWIDMRTGEINVERIHD